MISPPIEISVVIPAYNEERRLALTLPRVLAYLEQHYRGFEVLVVDDGSGDGTALAARAFADRGVRTISFSHNRGKGAAVRCGVLSSRGRAVLMTDADLSTPIEELASLGQHLEAAQLVLGSRAVGGSRVERPQPIHRRLMGWAFRQVVRCAGVGAVRDTQCGFKLIDGDVARELFADLGSEGFAFDVELIWLAQQRGIRVREVGVRWLDEPDSRVRPLLDSPAMLLELMLFRLRHAAGWPARGLSYPSPVRPRSVDQPSP